MKNSLGKKNERQTLFISHNLSEDTEGAKHQCDAYIRIITQYRNLLSIFKNEQGCGIIITSACAD